MSSGHRCSFIGTLNDKHRQNWPLEHNSEFPNLKKLLVLLNQTWASALQTHLGL